MSVTAMRVLLLGEPQDSERTKSAMFTSGSENMHIRYVKNEEEYILFGRDLMVIKHTISDLNDLKNNGSITESVYKERLKREWLDVVVATFVSSYGMNSVPRDVRIAVDDVREHLDLPMVRWPDFQFVVIVPTQEGLYFDM